MLVLQRGGHLVVRPSGHLGKAEGDGLLAEVSARLETCGQDVILDLAGVDYMTSSALSALILLYQRVRARGCRMALAAPGERVHLLLEVAGVNQLMKLSRTAEEAERTLATAAGPTA